MTRRRPKKYRRRSLTDEEKYSEALADLERAQVSVLVAAGKLAAARDLVRHYQRKLRGDVTVVVSRGLAEAVERVKKGARGLLERSGLDLPSEGPPRARGPATGSS